MLGVCLFMLGCGNIKAHLNDLPSIAFESVSYKRMGNISTAIIEAEGARVEGNVLYIDRVKIIENWPWISVDFQMEGYSRKLNNDDLDFIEEK